MTTALGYTRVSTKDQAVNGQSLQSQIEFIKRCAELNGLELKNTLSDEGISANNKKRPAFEEIMKAVKAKQINAVIVYSISRFARNTKTLLDSLEIMKKNSVRFISCKESIDTETAIGKFFVTIVSAVAELESGITGERISDTKKSCKEAKRVYTGHLYGFKNENSTHTLIPVESEQAVIREIFSLRGDGCSYDGIATRLNCDSIPTKKGTIWYASTVHAIVNNSIYTK